MSRVIIEVEEIEGVVGLLMHTEDMDEALFIPMADVPTVISRMQITLLEES